jgi:hypothetical protein
MFKHVFPIIIAVRCCETIAQQVIIKVNGRYRSVRVSVPARFCCRICFPDLADSTPRHEGLGPCALLTACSEHYGGKEAGRGCAGYHLISFQWRVDFTIDSGVLASNETYMVRTSCRPPSRCLLWHALCPLRTRLVSDNAP